MGPKKTAGDSDALAVYFMRDQECGRKMTASSEVMAIVPSNYDKRGKFCRNRINIIVG